MSFRDREWFINALEAAKARVAALQVRIASHIESDEFDAAKMLLPALEHALTDANNTANAFADKFGG